MARPRLVEVVVEAVRMHTATRQHAVILRARRGRKLLLLWIGLTEANAIALAHMGTPTERPTTADLAASLVSSLGGRLELVAIHSLAGQTFYAGLSIRRGEQMLELDARPSDAIALALRLKAPIYVASNLLQTEEKPAA